MRHQQIVNLMRVKQTILDRLTDKKGLPKIDFFRYSDLHLIDEIDYGLQEEFVDFLEEANIEHDVIYLFSDKTCIFCYADERHSCPRCTVEIPGLSCCDCAYARKKGRCGSVGSVYEQAYEVDDEAETLFHKKMLLGFIDEVPSHLWYN